MAKKPTYVVSVKGRPGHGARTQDKEYAEQVQAALKKRYGSATIKEKKR